MKSSDKRIEEVKKFAEEAVRRYDCIRSIVLIGSVARGDFTEKSDTDVAVIIDDSQQQPTSELRQI